MEEQRTRFERVRAQLAGEGVRPRLVHAANSAALLRDSRVWYDLVRPGLLLYGVVPPPLASTLPLRAGAVAAQPPRRREAHSCRARSSAMARASSPIGRRGSPSCPPDTPTGSTRGSRAAAWRWSAAAARAWSAPSAWTC